MKRLYMVGGPMGVGKTAACRQLQLQRLLDRSVFLDGDWCWDAHPFQVTEETREMVLENIAFLLNSFLRCSAYDHVIFCWVLHRREIWADLLRRLTEPYALRAISLVCTPEALRSRLEGDIRAGKRTPDVLDRSLAYLPLYEALDVRRKLGPDKIIGVSAQTVEQALLAEKHGADYLGVGAVFPTGSKDDADDVSYYTLKAICRAVSIPVVAIGGISRDNVHRLSGSGICGVAVISAIYGAADIRRASEDLKAAAREMLQA